MKTSLIILAAVILLFANCGHAVDEVSEVTTARNVINVSVSKNHSFIIENDESTMNLIEDDSTTADDSTTDLEDDVTDDSTTDLEEDDTTNDGLVENQVNNTRIGEDHSKNETVNDSANLTHDKENKFTEKRHAYPTNNASGVLQTYDTSYQQPQVQYVQDNRQNYVGAKSSSYGGHQSTGLVYEINEEEAKLRQYERTIPGVPGRDYPILYSVPQTGFQCPGQPGLYGDIESRCQTWHFCQEGGRMDSFLCANGSVFNQQYLVCDWWYNVECATTRQFYGVNAQYNQQYGNRPGFGYNKGHDHQGRPETPQQPTPIYRPVEPTTPRTVYPERPIYLGPSPQVPRVGITSGGSQKGDYGQWTSSNTIQQQGQVGTVGQGVSAGSYGKGVSTGSYGQGVSSGSYGHGILSGSYGQGVSSGIYGQGVSSGSYGQGVSSGSYGQAGVSAGSYIPSRPQGQSVYVQTGSHTSYDKGVSPSPVLAVGVSAGSYDQKSQTGSSKSGSSQVQSVGTYTKGGYEVNRQGTLNLYGTGGNPGTSQQGVSSGTGSYSKASSGVTYVQNVNKGILPTTGSYGSSGTYAKGSQNQVTSKGVTVGGGYNREVQSIGKSEQEQEWVPATGYQIKTFSQGSSQQNTGAVYPNPTSQHQDGQSGYRYVYSNEVQRNVPSTPQINYPSSAPSSGQTAVSTGTNGAYEYTYTNSHPGGSSTVYQASFPRPGSAVKSGYQYTGPDCGSPGYRCPPGVQIPRRVQPNQNRDAYYVDNTQILNTAYGGHDLSASGRVAGSPSVSNKAATVSDAYPQITY